MIAKCFITVRKLSGFTDRFTLHAGSTPVSVFDSPIFDCNVEVSSISHITKMSSCPMQDWHFNREYLRNNLSRHKTSKMRKETRRAESEEELHVW